MCIHSHITNEGIVWLNAERHARWINKMMMIKWKKNWETRASPGRHCIHIEFQVVKDDHWVNGIPRSLELCINIHIHSQLKYTLHQVIHSLLLQEELMIIYCSWWARLIPKGPHCNFIMLLLPSPIQALLFIRNFN